MTKRTRKQERTTTRKRKVKGGRPTLKQVTKQFSNLVLDVPKIKFKEAQKKWSKEKV